MIPRHERALLAAADELDNFQMRAFGERGGGPVDRLHDATVELDGHTGRVESQRFEQWQNGVSVRHRAALAVDHDLNGSVG
jgi:hypothetical protein